jgi:hypothetical protein
VETRAAQNCQFVSSHLRWLVLQEMRDQARDHPIE